MSTFHQPSPVYLDYAATTPVEARVLDVMLPCLRESYGNPASTHTVGQRAEAAVEQAREDVAALLHCDAREIVFTGSGSESDNLALRGVALAQKRRRGATHLLVAAGEHQAVARTAADLVANFGFTVDLVPFDAEGRINPRDVAAKLHPQTALVSVMYANNEIGSVNAIGEIGALCRRHQVPLHTDAVQAAAYLSLDVSALQVDLLSFGAHKLYGPKGVGALFVRQGTPIVAVQTGGDQEHGLRAGTHNVAGIVGLGEALRLASEERVARTHHVLALRDFIIGSVLGGVVGAQLTGARDARLPHHASFVFDRVEGNTLLSLLDVEGFACSSGSACKSGDPKPSSVLLALGLAPELALSSLRVTLGKATTPKDVERFVAVLPRLIDKVRQG